MSSKIVSLGMDDIDSPRGGCTTHFASLLVEWLEPLIDTWLDYPNLIRLNPNIPYRTRGNGSVCLKFKSEPATIQKILPMISDRIREYADLSYHNTNPGVVLVVGKIPSKIHKFSQKAIWRTVPKTLASRLISEYDIPHIIHGNGRGIIGALASIGHGLEGDHTYEYLSYRNFRFLQETRGVNHDSVKRMDEATKNCTFSNLDPSSDTILIEPQGPDPVLFGIRGENPECVIDAASYIKSTQKTERWMIFRTNQGTGEHLVKNVQIKDIRPYMSASLTGKVVEAPKIISGGHIMFQVSDGTGTIQCAAYEPTGDFRWNIMKLLKGDKITLYAGVRPASYSYNMTLNVEGMLVQQLVDDIKYSNPLCSDCGKRMKSAGKNQGFRCPKCGNKTPNKQKIQQKTPREIDIGYFLPDPTAQRHLTRPYKRLNKRNRFSQELIQTWHYP